MRLTELSAGSSFVEIDADEDPWTSKEDGEAELSRDVDGNIVSASVPLSVFKRPRLSSICTCEHVDLALCCLAFAKNVLQSFEQQRTESSLT